MKKAGVFFVVLISVLIVFALSASAQLPAQYHMLNEVVEGIAVFATTQGFVFNGNTTTGVIVGNNTATILNRNTPGMAGTSDAPGSTTGPTGYYAGVMGINTNTSFPNPAINPPAGYGRTGVLGMATGFTYPGGQPPNPAYPAVPNFGVVGIANVSVAGVGVYGIGNAQGVVGYAPANTGTTYGVRGQVSSSSGIAGYFSGGLGMRIDNSGTAFANSSVGDTFACINGITPDNTCNAICQSHGLTCQIGMHNFCSLPGGTNFASCWLNPPSTSCSSTCASAQTPPNYAAAGIILCYCA